MDQTDYQSPSQMTRPSISLSFIDLEIVEQWNRQADWQKKKNTAAFTNGCSRMKSLQLSNS